MSLLHQLTSLVQRSQKRVGRGYGSGKGGHTSGRGTKGQLSRPGGKMALWFEGGQLPLIKRLPMWRGKSRFEVVRPVAEVNLTDLDRMTATDINLETLKLEKIIGYKFAKAKIIKSGQLTRSVTVRDLPVTAGAKLAIEAAGGRVETAPQP